MGKNDLSDCIEVSKDGTYLDVRVSPDSRINEITGVNQWRNQLEVSIEEEARDGKANRELVNFFSELLDIPSKETKIVKGKAAKNKRLYFAGVEKDRLIENIEIELDK